MITVTDAAKDEVRRLIGEHELSDSVLRMGVRGGGCSGLSYTLGFDKEVSEYDTVIELDAPCTPQELHIHLKAVESALGRPERRERNSPRTLDLDLLYADEVISNDPSLILPHPRLHLRRFVLQPLADIRPNLVLPGHSTCIADLLSRLKDDPSSVRRYS